MSASASSSADVPAGRRPRRPSGPVLAVVVVGVLALVIAALAFNGSSSEPSDKAASAAADAAAGPRPNVLVFLLDDANDFPCDQTRTYLPQTAKFLVSSGASRTTTCFENATTPNPVCCPARAVVQSGQLPHNNGVTQQRRALQFDSDRSMQHLLSGAGYRTSMVGKLFNGVTGRDLATHGPLGQPTGGGFETGFDEFAVIENYDYYDYFVTTDDGQRLHPGVHSALFAGEVGRRYITQALDEGTPFFHYAAFYQPHDQVDRNPRKPSDVFPTPTPAHADSPVPRFRYSPERNAEDKLPIFEKSRDTRAFFAAKFRRRTQSVYDVDTQIAATLQLLQDRGALDDTRVIITSDNGVHLGEQNWASKTDPYNAAVRVPMYAIGLKSPSRYAIDRRLVSLVDIAPTVYRAAGITDPGYVVDGYPLQDGTSRRFVLGEHLAERDGLVAHESGSRASAMPSWRSITVGRFKLIEWLRGDPSSGVRSTEFYDDPSESRNLLYYADRARGARREPLTPRERRLVTRMRVLLHQKATCRGTGPSVRNPC